MSGQMLSGNAGILDRLTLRYGPTPESEPLTIRPGAMTVLVGPNNSGKSLLLREIRDHVSGRSRKSDENLVLQRCTPRLPDEAGLRDLFAAAIRHDHAILEEGNTSIRELSEALRKAGEDGAKLHDVMLPLVVLGHAGDLLRHFRGLVDRGLIEPQAFCRTMGLEDGSPLVRVLQGTTEIELMSVLRASRSDEVAEFVQLIKEGLDLRQRFESYLSDPARVAELVAAQVVDLENYREVLGPFTVLLDGYSRLRQIEPRPLDSFYEPPKNYLTMLHRNPEKLEELRNRVHDTFGFYLAIDILDMEKARFVAAGEHPDGREFSLDADARKYFLEARDLRELSDGVRSFVGIHAALTSNDYRLILIDEPEAFLHPPLVRRLGSDLTRMAVERGASIIAATHSADFLMGCIEASPSVDIIRLDYENDIATARSLPAGELGAMMSDPLLRSTGVLSALFHRAAVVCEGDTDGAFYREINERLRLQAEKRSAQGADDSQLYVRDAVFINAHSKQSVPRLMGALRRVGIPAAAIVDLDLLLDKDVVPELLKHADADQSVYTPIGEWRRRLEEKYRQLAEAQVPPVAGDAGEAARSKREKDVRNRTSALIKRGGIRHLEKRKDRDAMIRFLDNLADDGIFVPECGDLESWLPTVSKGMGKSKEWLPKMFRLMGTVGQDDYVSPGDDDVWAFMRKIASWIERRLASPS